MARGELVSDAIVSALIGERLDQGVGAGAIFDGFPRTAAQAEALELLLAKRGQSLDHVIELTVDEAALTERIVGRYTCAKCGEGYHDTFKQPTVAGVCEVCGSTEFKRRPDDTAETIATRMAVYRGDTAPILPFYEARGLVRRIDGMADIDHVAAAIAAILDG
jgi:adenylate kinase